MAVRAFGKERENAWDRCSALRGSSVDMRRDLPSGLGIAAQLAITSLTPHRLSYV